MSTAEQAGHGLILMYHRVAVLERDMFGLAVRPETFRSHLAYLRAQWQAVVLQELVEDRAGGTPPQGIAVTLDDGYADGLLAAEMLVAAGVPATFFVTTGPFDAAGDFWWDGLEALLLDSDPLPPNLSLPGIAVLPTATPEDRRRAFDTLHAALFRATLDEREGVLAALRAWSGYAPPDRESHRVMSAMDVRRLAGLPGLSIGAHGEHHLALPCQPLVAQREEAAGSKARLEGLLGEAVPAFAYPFGFWDEGVVEVVRSAGFTMAVTTQPGTVREASDALRLPRLEIRECSVEELDRQMRAALDAPAA